MDAFNEAFARAIEIHHEGGLAAIDGDMLEDRFRHAKTEAMRGEEPGSRREEPRESKRVGVKAGLFIRQAKQRFGSVPKTARKLIRGASVLELEAWQEALLTAASLDEVLASGPGR
ncbi:MAG: hypothetical protein OXC28_21915 [Defluviicoccus sp.]|nr:hypothetical protein [Defluviicoccus sp.]